MSNWTAEKIDKLKSGGQIQVRVVYTDGTEKLDEMVRTSSVYPGWPDDVINNRLDGLNALDLTAITLGVPQPRKAPAPPTQDELDQRAFSLATQNVISINGQLVAAANSKVPTKRTPQDLADAYAAWKVALSVNPDVFLAQTPKDFPYQ